MIKLKIEELSHSNLKRIIDELWKRSNEDYIDRGLDTGENYMDFCSRKKHCEKTAQIALNLYYEYGDNFEKYKDVLNFACQIHDIRKIKIDCSHGKAAKKFFQEHINEILNEILEKESKIEKNDIRIIGNIVRYHNGKDKQEQEKFSKEVDRFIQLKYEEPEVMALLLFMRIADKLSKYPYKPKEVVIKKAVAQTESIILADENLLDLREQIIKNVDRILDFI